VPIDAVSVAGEMDTVGVALITVTEAEALPER
jgi:hypothetical protein